MNCIQHPLRCVAPLFPQRATVNLGKYGSVCHSRAHGHHPDTSSVEVVWQLKHSNSTSVPSALVTICVFQYVTAKTFLNKYLYIFSNIFALNFEAPNIF